MGSIRNLIGITGYYISALALCSLLTPVAVAATATVTTLTVTPSNTLAAQQIATLTASVQAAGQPVTVGTISFYDGKLYLGSVQVVRSASKGYTVGTATYKGALRIGTHSLIATFLPTATLATSSSSAQTVTVSGPGPATPLPTSMWLTSASPGFTGTLSAFGPTKPTGSVVFTDQTTNSTLATAQVNPGNFTPGFSPSAPSLSIPVTGLEGIFADDFNGDGLPDFLVEAETSSSPSLLQAYINQGNGTFKAAAPLVGPEPVSNTPVVIADFNGDGIPDIAYIGVVAVVSSNGSNATIESGLIVSFGAGDGTFPTSETVVTNAGGAGPLIGDFNGDGIPDLMINGASGSWEILLGNADGTFQTTNPLTTTATGGVVGDYNQDGIADLASTTSGCTACSVQILLGNGDGTFQAPANFGEMSGFNIEVLGTVQSRGNGISDLVVGYRSQANPAFGEDAIGVLVGNGDGTFLPATTYSPGTNFALPGQLLAGDFTGDGQMDIVLVNVANLDLTQGYLSLYAGNGDGTFQQVQNSNFFSGTATGGFPSPFAAVDIDGDGVSDLAAFGNIDDDFASSTIYFLSDSFEGNSYYSENITVSPSSPGIPGTGAQQLVATYSGDSNYRSSTSNPVYALPSSLALGQSTELLNIAAGSTGTATLTVTPVNFYNGTVKFNCSGLPANSSCSFSPSTVTLNGAPAKTTLTVATNVQVSANRDTKEPWPRGGLSFALLAGIGLLAGSRQVNKRLRQFSKTSGCVMVLVLGLMTALVLGCSGSGASSGDPTAPTQPAAPVTPAGTSTITVNAIDTTTPSISASTTLEVIVTN